MYTQQKLTLSRSRQYTQYTINIFFSIPSIYHQYTFSIPSLYPLYTHSIPIYPLLSQVLKFSLKYNNLNLAIYPAYTPWHTLYVHKLCLKCDYFLRTAQSPHRGPCRGALVWLAKLFRWLSMPARPAQVTFKLCKKLSK